MKKYIKYCSSEQTLRALKLGAQLESGIANSGFHGDDRPFIYRAPDENSVAWNNSACWFCPTTQQMIWWLREKGFKFEFTEVEDGIWFKTIYDKCHKENIVSTYEQAELAAIDTALDYLEQEGLYKSSSNDFKDDVSIEGRAIKHGFEKYNKTEYMLIGRNSYTIGATEQREIDIQRAVEWFRYNVGYYLDKEDVALNIGTYICSMITDFENAMKGGIK